jgi:hypothetical protein
VDLAGEVEDLGERVSQLEVSAAKVQKARKAQNTKHRKEAAALQARIEALEVGKGELLAQLATLVTKAELNAVVALVDNAVAESSQLQPLSYTPPPFNPARPTFGIASQPQPYQPQQPPPVQYQPQYYLPQYPPQQPIYAPPQPQAAPAREALHRLADVSNLEPLPRAQSTPKRRKGASRKRKQ